MTNFVRGKNHQTSIIMNFWKKTFVFCFLCCMPMLLHAVNEKPFTVPELKTWKGGEGVFAPARITYEKGDAMMLETLQRFADDYAAMFGQRLPIVKGKAKQGDIAFVVKAQKGSRAESYAITIGESAKVTAPTNKGLFWATRTILQIAEQSVTHTLPCGTLTDYPDYAIRGFMLDCGRKFFPMRSLRQYVKLMSYYKMNTFHLHLSDCGFKQFFDNDWMKTQAAFRLECDTYPGLTARDGFYTKKEFIELQKYADSLGVEIIPEIDVPAHSLAITKYRPDLASKEYGMDHLDLFNPDTYTFLDGLFKEYLEGPNPVFRSKWVHIGTDEYSNKTVELREKFRYFTDRYIRYVESFGKKAVIWGQQTHAYGTTPIKVKDVMMQLWSNDYAKPEDMLKLGYDVVSIPDGEVYIVPKAGYYYDYLENERLYKEWTPAHVNGVVFPERHPQIKGGMFAVWNDIVGNGVSLQDIYHRVLPSMQTLATKMWTGATPTFSYAKFKEKCQKLSEAVGQSVLGRQAPDFKLELAQVRPGQETGVDQMGWDYRVEFDIDARVETPGTVLFESDESKFYLADPVSGFLGFSRNGYLYNFGVSPYPGEKAHVAIEGTPERTVLYLNGKKVSSLDVKKVNFGKRGDMYYLRTLVFPLQKAGQFKSVISNLRVTHLKAAETE